jgi:hypothetical protein
MQEQHAEQATDHDEPADLLEQRERLLAVIDELTLRAGGVDRKRLREARWRVENVHMR